MIKFRMFKYVYKIINKTGQTGITKKLLSSSRIDCSRCYVTLSHRYPPGAKGSTAPWPARPVRPVHDLIDPYMVCYARTCPARPVHDPLGPHMIP